MTDINGKPLTHNQSVRTKDGRGKVIIEQGRWHYVSGVEKWWLCEAIIRMLELEIETEETK